MSQDETKEDSVSINSLKEFHIDSLFKETYKKIAEWHNDESNISSTSLKHLSLEIVEDIAGAIFNHFGLTYTSDLDLDENLRSKLQTEKNNMKQGSFHRNINHLSDAELLEEIERRKQKMT